LWSVAVSRRSSVDSVIFADGGPPVTRPPPRRSPSFGYDWLIGHTIEAVEPDEMQRRYTALLSGDQQNT
jgi:hypothetical protein